MGANAVVKCLTVVENVEKVLAIELLTAMQAIGFRQRKTSSYLQQIKEAYRTKVSFNEADRMLYKDIEATVTFIKSYELPKIK
jgi:histidine ammonia-lyase